jgi:signal transduction histidine kinase
MEKTKTKTNLVRPFTRRKQLERDLAHVTQEMYRHNRELTETNKILSLLRTIDNLVLSSQSSVKDLSNQIAAAITEKTDYPFVAVLGITPHANHTLELYGASFKKGSVASPELVDINNLRVSIHAKWFSSAKNSKVIQLKRFSRRRMAHVLHTSVDKIEDALKVLPIHSIYLVKLQARQKLVGAIAIGFVQPIDELDKFDTELIDQLGEAVGVALDSKKLFEENQRILAQVRRTNAKLRALDRAKDEFISLASHQLRTPLTTVKGYLSMVLEGETGALKKEQKELITRAYDGAERMVFLIGDLLNISRLQSGKFTIENKETDLVQIIDSEVHQLQETAKAHQLTLEFNKPDKFPHLMVDETKMRQVIMNFIDNAIYYTPAGGKVTIDVFFDDNKVSYTVTDTGLGVPKAEQHKLFSKFYRAANARKMRPDGTGLGLYMARRVIAAQGGALVFKSTEGKGSVFGFTFPRAKVEVKH